MHDAADRNRMPCGELQGNSKLTVEIVLSIRAASGTISELSKIYNVSRKTIRDIKTLKTWRSV